MSYCSPPTVLAASLLQLCFHAYFYTILRKEASLQGTGQPRHQNQTMEFMYTIDNAGPFLRLEAFSREEVILIFLQTSNIPQDQREPRVSMLILKHGDGTFHLVVDNVCVGTIPWRRILYFTTEGGSSLKVPLEYTWVRWIEKRMSTLATGCRDGWMLQSFTYLRGSTLEGFGMNR